MMWKNGYRVSRRPTSAWWNDVWRLNRQMDHIYGGTLGPIRREHPLLEVWSGDEGLIVIAKMPGIDGDGTEITVDGRTLTISGSRPSTELPEGARSYRQERAGGQFSRSVTLPFDVHVERIKASYHDGMLRIELPRLPEEKPRRITVNGN